MPARLLDKGPGTKTTMRGGKKISNLTSLDTRPFLGLAHMQKDVVAASRAELLERVRSGQTVNRAPGKKRMNKQEAATGLSVKCGHARSSNPEYTSLSLSLRCRSRSSSCCQIASTRKVCDEEEKVVCNLKSIV